MARLKKQPPVVATKNKKPVVAATKNKKAEDRRQSNLERSGYFARRQAAKVLRSVLKGDAKRRAVASIKSLIYEPSVRNKKACFALVCQTLKHLSIIKDVLEDAKITSKKWMAQQELVYLITYDILFGKESSLVGNVEKFLMLKKEALKSALARILAREKVKSVKDLMALREASDVPKPRYVRVNTLKLDVKSAARQLRKKYKVLEDDTVPGLLILPPGCDLHDHPLVLDGSIFLQGKASSMVAAALDPKPGWEVLDACSAPGNKTVHLAALMGGEGNIIACELDKDRVERLGKTVKLSGATNIEVLHGDFLKLNPKDPSYSKVRAILLDPSCSGSGTSADRLDHLLPSFGKGHTDTERLKKLAVFQKKALAHALSFPSVERVAYSTCSIHQIENEDVIQSVLPLAESYGFQLETPFPNWPHRGLPVFEGAERLLRTDPVEDSVGFFIALFARKAPTNVSEQVTAKCDKRCCSNKKRVTVPLLHCRLSKMWFQLQLN